MNREDFVQCVSEIIDSGRLEELDEVYELVIGYKKIYAINVVPGVRLRLDNQTFVVDTNQYQLVPNFCVINGYFERSGETKSFTLEPHEQLVIEGPIP